MLRLSLHPAGLSPRIENLREWRMQLLQRLDRQIATIQDVVLVRLREELVTCSGDQTDSEERTPDSPANVAVPLRLCTTAGTLSFISTTTVFGTSRDVMLSELANEAFFPADPETAAMLANARP